MPLTPDEVRRAAHLLDRRDAVKRAQDHSGVPGSRVLVIESEAGCLDGVALPLSRAQVDELLAAEYAALTGRLRQLGVEPGP